MKLRLLYRFLTKTFSNQGKREEKCVFISVLWDERKWRAL